MIKLNRFLMGRGASRWWLVVGGWLIEEVLHRVRTRVHWLVGSFVRLASWLASWLVLSY